MSTNGIRLAIGVSKLGLKINAKCLSSLIAWSEMEEGGVNEVLSWVEDDPGLTIMPTDLFGFMAYPISWREGTYPEGLTL
jgi:hypothetical protein